MSDRLRHNENRKPRRRGLSPLQMKQRIEELEWIVGELASCCDFPDYRATTFRDVDGCQDIYCCNCGHIIGLTFGQRRVRVGT